MQTQSPTPTPQVLPPICATPPAGGTPLVACYGAENIADCFEIQATTGDCTTIIPKLTIPLSNWGLDDVGFPGVEICPVFIQAPVFTLFGSFNVDVGMIAALLIGMFVARLLWAQMGG